MDKLSFRKLDSSAHEYCSLHYPEGYAELSVMLDSFLEVGLTGAEVYFAIGFDCLLIRIFDGGEYSFVFPLPFLDAADTYSALVAVRDYAVREMIPLILTDVLREDLCLVTRLFKMPEVRAYPDEDDLFFVRAVNECESVKELCPLKSERLCLDLLRDEDLNEYARLCQDREINRYWGYDVDVDNIDARREFHLEVARRELEHAISATLGVYRGGVLIGEAVLYAFDFSGGASVGVRLLPEYHGMGLGTEAMCLAVDLARKIGLDYLTAEVMKENKQSLKMTAKVMGDGIDFGDRVGFKLTLN